MINFGMIFPGQGSQFVGMLSSFIKEFSLVKKIFIQSSDILGYDLLNLIQNGPREELDKTYKTQPAILASSFAIFKIWKNKTEKMPIVMAGHSLGEYSALVCSGAIDFQSALKLVEFRGKLMQKCVLNKKGFMYAIVGLNSSLVSKFCEQNSRDQIVSISNFNSLNQVIVSGEKKALLNVINLCKLAGAKRIIRLPISVPAHCKLMKSISKKFSRKLNKINFCKPKIPVVNNVDVKIEYSVELIKDALVRQMYSPVRWMDLINFIVNKKKIHLLLEIGPNKILSSLNKDIIKSIDSISVNTIFSLDFALNKV